MKELLYVFFGLNVVAICGLELSQEVVDGMLLGWLSTEDEANSSEHIVFSIR